MTIKPSYGRDYKTKAEVLKAFVTDEKDFTMAITGLQMSIRDLKDGDWVNIRYDRLRKALVFIKGRTKV